MTKRDRPPFTPSEDEEIALFRDVVGAAVSRTSLRGTARQIGMSPTGVRGFLNGSRPYGKTVEKMREWVATSPEAKTDLLPQTALALLRRILGNVPRVEQREALVELLAAVETVHGRFGVAVPGWLVTARGLLVERR
jgi:hypothetical protein